MTSLRPFITTAVFSLPASSCSRTSLSVQTLCMVTRHAPRHFHSTPRGSRDDFFKLNADGENGSSSSRSAAEQRRLLEELRRASGGSGGGAAVGQHGSSDQAESILKGTSLGSGAGAPPSMGLGLGSSIYSAPSRRPRGLVAKATGEGKSWSELKTGQKFARGTQKSYQFSMVLGGAVLVVLIVSALGSELYAPNSPTVIFKDACRRVEDTKELYDHLLPPLRFTSTPPSEFTFTSSPSPFTRPTGRRSRSTASETQAIVPDREDTRSPTQEDPFGGQVKLVRFYIQARDKDRDWTYMEMARQGCADAYRRVKDEGVQLYENVVDYIQQQGEGSSDDSTAASVFGALGAGSEDKATTSTPPAQPSWLTRTFKAMIPSSTASAVSSLTRKAEPGTFSTGQVHGEMKYDAETREWQYRKMWVDIPRGGAPGGRRVWITKRQGEVVR